MYSIRQGIPVFGPSKAAAQLEGSKGICQRPYEKNITYRLLPMVYSTRWMKQKNLSVKQVLYRSES